MATSHDKKHIVFDLGAVLFHWQPEAMLQRELPHVVQDEAAARHWAAHTFAGFIHGAQFYVDGGIDAMSRPTQF